MTPIWFYSSSKSWDPESQSDIPRPGEVTLCWFDGLSQKSQTFHDPKELFDFLYSFGLREFKEPAALSIKSHPKTKVEIDLPDLEIDI